MTTELLDIALAARRAGISVVPPAEDGTKRPIETWKRFQSEAATEEQVRAWYGPRVGLGFVCGAVSFGLECLEFDDRATYEAFKQRASLVELTVLVARLEAGYLEESPGGGIHWFYRTDEIRGNTKLARRPDTPDPTTAKPRIKVLIETRGEGGFVIVAPSGGQTHPTGRPYRLLAGGIESIAVLSAQERESLWELARSFDEMPKPEAEKPKQWKLPAGTDRPGDVYNQYATWPEVLEPAGWTQVFTRGEETFWRRPGKAIGVSATTNYKGSGLLFVFSSSTEFEPERSYDRFGAYAKLHHGGDLTAAAKDVRAQGYGAPASENGQHDADDEPPDQTTACEVADPEAERLHLTDLGNGRRLAQAFGADLHFCGRLGAWFCWDGKRWAEDGLLRIERLAKEVPRILWDEAVAARAAGDHKLSKKLVNFSLETESQKRRDALLKSARSEGAIPMEPNDFNRDQWLLNVRNGTVDLKTGELRPHRKADLITMMAGASYNPTAECPRWRDFLTIVMAGNDAMVRFLQRALGYSLTGNTGEHVLFFAYGKGRNGKSTLINVVQKILGDYAWSVDPTLFMSKNQEQHSTGLTDLQHRRFVATVEVEQGRKLAESLVKQTTGGDSITARRMRQDHFTFTPTHKLWFAANHKPVIRGTDVGIWSRINLIPFTVQIPESERVRDYHEVLFAEEASGILRWMVEGCAMWRTNPQGLEPPEVIAEAVAEYKRDEDVLADFLAEWCVLERDQRAKEGEDFGLGKHVYKVKFKDLYGKYIEWANEEKIRPVSRKAFGTDLLERGFTKRPSSGMLYEGLELRRFPASEEQDMLDAKQSV